MTIFLIQGVLIRVFSFFNYMYFDIYKHVVSTLDQIYTPIFWGLNLEDCGYYMYIYSHVTSEYDHLTYRVLKNAHSFATPIFFGFGFLFCFFLRKNSETLQIPTRQCFFNKEHSSYYRRWWNTCKPLLSFIPNTRLQIPSWPIPALFTRFDFIFMYTCMRTVLKKSIFWSWDIHVHHYTLNTSENSPFIKLII